MKQNPYRENREEMKELLKQYNNLREGNNHSFIEEEAFERVIDYFDDKENMPAALEASDYAVNQYPYSAMLKIKKADILIATRNYREALALLENAELLDKNDINLYILKTEAFLALDQQKNAAILLEEAIQTFTGQEKLNYFSSFQMSTMIMKNLIKYLIA